MFGSKSKKIKELLNSADQDHAAITKLESGNRSLVYRVKELEDIIAVGKPDNERLRQERLGLLAERDQLMKRVEDLEAELKRFKDEKSAQAHPALES